MIRLSTLLQNTPGNIHANSQSVRAKITSSVINADAGGEHFLIKGLAMDPTTTKKNYRQLVKLYLDENGKVPNNPMVFVWCGCPWFKYFCEVALAIRGSSYIINANGALPKITNPSARPQCCKHMLAFLRKVRANQETLRVDTARQTKQAIASGRAQDKNIDDLLISKIKSNMQDKYRKGKPEAGVLPERLI